MADEQTTSSPGGTNFIIRELTGDQRTIELVGRALPYRPIVFSGTQATDKTYYGGNPIATQQVFGPQEDPSDFGGYWKDRFIKQFTPEGQRVQPEGSIMVNGEAVATVKDGVELLDDVRRKGQQCEVSWAHIKRQGILQKFEQKWHRVQDVEWSMHFEWASQGDAQMPTVVSGRTSVGDIASDLDNAVTSLREAAVPPDDMEVDTGIVDTINAKIDKLASAVEDLQGAVEGAIDFVLSPFDVARRIASTLAGMVGTCQDLLEQMWDTPPGYILAAALTNPDSLSSGEVLAVDLYVNDVVVAARAVQEIAVEQQENVGVDADPDVIAIFYAQAGTDLRAVATEYYGSDEQWKELAAYNDMDMGGSELQAGQVVYVPRLQILQHPLDVSSAAGG